MTIYPTFELRVCHRVYTTYKTAAHAIYNAKPKKFFVFSFIQKRVPINSQTFCARNNIRHKTHATTMIASLTLGFILFFFFKDSLKRTEKTCYILFYFFCAILCPYLKNYSGDLYSFSMKSFL